MTNSKSKSTKPMAKTVSAKANVKPKSAATKTSSKIKLESRESWQYAAAPESVDHVSIKPQYDLFINGKFVKPNSKNILIPIVHPPKIN